MKSLIFGAICGRLLREKLKSSSRSLSRGFAAAHRRIQNKRMMHLQWTSINRNYFSYNFFFQQHLRTYSDVAKLRQKKPKQPEGAGTECVLCTSACFTEHLSADPGESSSVAKEGGGRGEWGGVGLRTIVSPSTMRASEKASQQSLQQPPGTHGNRYGPVFGDGGVSGGREGQKGGRKEESERNVEKWCRSPAFRRARSSSRCSRLMSHGGGPDAEAGPSQSDQQP